MARRAFVLRSWCTTPADSRPVAQQRHNETERQYKEVKRVLEELREGVRRAEQRQKLSERLACDVRRQRGHLLFGGLDQQPQRVQTVPLLLTTSGS